MKRQRSYNLRNNVKNKVDVKNIDNSEIISTKLDGRINKILENNPFDSIYILNIFLAILNNFNKTQITDIYSSAIVDKIIDKNNSFADIGGFYYMFAIEYWNDYLVKEYTIIRNKEKKIFQLSESEMNIKYNILKFLLL